MSADKNEIRSEMRARRKAVTPEARAAAGKELSRRLFVENRALGAAMSAKGPTAVYLASKEEIDLSDFIAAALSFGCAVVVPRWNGTDYELVRFSDLATLVKGPHNILEPPAGPVVRPEDVRVWLVPGLAFTQDGGRLGYGGGWYDRLLARAAKHAPKIGIAYGFQIVNELPTEPHDIRLTFVESCEDLIVYSGCGKSIRPKRSRGPICRFLDRACLWGVVAIFAALPVIVPLDIFRRCRGAQGHLTGFMILELFVLAVMLWLFIAFRRDASRKKRHQYWNALSVR